MDKFNYSTYNQENTDCAFTDSSYVNPTTELETRKQLSYPLKELKTYINSTTTIDDSDNVLQLKLDITENALKYSADGEEWTALDFYGEQGSPGPGVPTGGNAGTILVKNSPTDYDTRWTTASGLDSASAVGLTDKMILEQSTGVKGASVSQIVDLIYPIGALYLSVDSASPSVLFGGTWEQITSDAYLKIVTTDGGTLGGTSSEHKIPIESMPPHTHTYTYSYYARWTETSDTPSCALYNTTGNTGSAGGGQAYYPYYLGVYVWKRVA